MGRARIGWGIGMVCVSLIVGQQPARGFSNGPPSGFNGSTASGGSDCTVCHSGVAGSGPGSVQILGLPAAYAPSAIYNLTVRVEDSGQVGGGFQLSAESPGGSAIGTFAPADANSQLNLSFIDHTSTGVDNSIANWGALGNAAEYDVSWQAPGTNEGPVTFWVAGNAINDSGTNSGDNIYLANTTVLAGSGIPTLGEWGLTLMVILLLTAGTILMGHRRIEAAPARARSKQ